MEPGTKVMIEATVVAMENSLIRLRTKSSDILFIDPSDLTVCEKAEVDADNWKVMRDDPDFNKVGEALKFEHNRWRISNAVGKEGNKIWHNYPTDDKSTPTITGQQALKLLGVESQPIDLNNFCVAITNPVNAELLPGFKEWYRKNCNWYDPTPAFNSKYYGVKVGDFSFWDSLDKPPVCTLPELQKQHPGVFETQQSSPTPTPSFKAGQEVEAKISDNEMHEWVKGIYLGEDVSSCVQPAYLVRTGGTYNSYKYIRPIPAQPTVESELEELISHIAGVGYSYRFNNNDMELGKRECMKRFLAWHQKHSGRVEVSVPSDEENTGAERKERNDDTECICITECLGCFHKDRKCKKLKGYYR